jgi:hypothetical protein
MRGGLALPGTGRLTTDTARSAGPDGGQARATGRRWTPARSALRRRTTAAGIASPRTARLDLVGHVGITLGSWVHARKIVASAPRSPLRPASLVAPSARWPRCRCAWSLGTLRIGVAGAAAVPSGPPVRVRYVTSLILQHQRDSARATLALAPGDTRVSAAARPHVGPADDWSRFRSHVDRGGPSHFFRMR